MFYVIAITNAFSQALALGELIMIPVSRVTAAKNAFHGVLDSGMLEQLIAL